MSYQLPEEKILVKYLAMLRAVLIETRNCSYGPNPRAAKLLDVVENVPDLLCRFTDMDEKLIFDELRDYEKKYLAGANKFTRILEEGPGEYWQTKTIQ